MTARERRLVVALVEANPMHPVAVQQAQAALRPLLAKRRSGPSKSLPERSQKQRREEKRAAHRDTTHEVRLRCSARADGMCECGCGRLLGIWGEEMDHWITRGQRRELTTVENCWMLATKCHRLRTDNRPSAADWNSRRQAHCDRYLYPFTPHRVHDTARRSPRG